MANVEKGMMHNYEPDVIDIPNSWVFSVKQMKAFEGLLKYNCVISTPSLKSDKEKTLTIRLPMKMRPEEYVEVGYLLAQIGKNDFPQNYERFGFSTDCWSIESAVSNPTIRFKDVCPPGYYRVSLKIEISENDEAPNQEGSLLEKLRKMFQPDGSG